MVRSRNSWHDVTDADLDVLRDYLRPEVDGAGRRAEVMTPEAEQALSKVVLVRLTYLYWPMLREGMRQILLEQNPLAGISLRLVKGAERREALRRAAEGLLGDGLGPAFERYPELGRLDGIFRGDLERLADEICAIVRTQRPAIAQQFFAGADVGRISSLSLPMNQDPRTRPGGRMRLFVDTEAGRFLYKPYDLAHHGAFERIAGWLFPELGLDTALLQADDALLQAGDAWLMAYVAQDLPKGGEELQSYARHAGLEVALFCTLGSADLHRGNFIVRGTVPVPIDLEQLLPYPDVSIGVDAETWLAAQLFPDDKRLSFLRIPLGVAHAFMFAMGVGVVYTRRGAPADLMRRGVRIYLLGYVLNFCRYGFYALAEGILSGVFEPETLEALFGQDILQFAGLALLVTGALKQLGLRADRMLVVGIALSVFGSAMPFVHTGNFALDCLLGHLVVTTHEASCFAFCNWYVFVAAGQVFGAVMRKAQEPDRLYLRLGIASGCVMAAYLVATLAFGPLFLCRERNYYAVSTLEAAGLLSCDLSLLAASHVLVRRFGDAGLRLPLEMSQNLTAIYFIHWCILGLVDSVFYYLLDVTFSWLEIYGIGTALLVVSFLLARMWRRSRLGGGDQTTDVIGET